MKELLKQLAQHHKVVQIQRTSNYNKFEVITNDAVMHKFEGEQGVINFLDKLNEK